MDSWKMGSIVDVVMNCDIIQKRLYGTGFKQN